MDRIRNTLLDEIFTDFSAKELDLFDMERQYHFAQSSQQTNSFRGQLDLDETDQVIPFGEIDEMAERYSSQIETRQRDNHNLFYHHQQQLHFQQQQQLFNHPQTQQPLNNSTTPMSNNNMLQSLVSPKLEPVPPSPYIVEPGPSREVKLSVASPTISSSCEEPKVEEIKQEVIEKQRESVKMKAGEKSNDSSTNSSPSQQLHVAKKQRIITTASELLEEVRESYAYIQGADIYAPSQQQQQQHSSLMPTSKFVHHIPPHNSETNCNTDDYSLPTYLNCNSNAQLIKSNSNYDFAVMNSTSDSSSSSNDNNNTNLNQNISSPDPEKNSLMLLPNKPPPPNRTFPPLQDLIHTTNPAFTKHPLYKLLRDIIIADMNFLSPNFPCSLILSLPENFDRLIHNYMVRNPQMNFEQVDPYVHPMIMDALKFAHSTLISKIMAKKLEEGHRLFPNKVQVNSKNVEDLCDYFASHDNLTSNSSSAHMSYPGSRTPQLKTSSTPQPAMTPFNLDNTPFNSNHHHLRPNNSHFNHHQISHPHLFHSPSLNSFQMYDSDLKRENLIRSQSVTLPQSTPLMSSDRFNSPVMPQGMSPSPGISQGMMPPFPPHHFHPPHHLSSSSSLHSSTSSLPYSIECNSVGAPSMLPPLSSSSPSPYPLPHHLHHHHQQQQQQQHLPNLAPSPSLSSSSSFLNHQYHHHHNPHLMFMMENERRGGIQSLPSSPRKLMMRGGHHPAAMMMMMNNNKNNNNNGGGGGSVGPIEIGIEKTGKNKVLPKEAVNAMIDWLRKHEDNPYPNDDEKESLINQTKLTINQINYWFTNARRRILPKWNLQRHLEEQERMKSSSTVLNNSSNSNNNNSNNNNNNNSGSSSGGSSSSVAGEGSVIGGGVCAMNGKLSVVGGEKSTCASGSS